MESWKELATAVGLIAAVIFVWARVFARRMSHWDLIVPIVLMAVLERLPLHALWGWWTLAGSIFLWVLFHLKYPIRMGSWQGAVRGVLNIVFGIGLLWLFARLISRL